MLFCDKPNLDKPEKTKNKKQNSNNSKYLICHLRLDFCIFCQKKHQFQK